MKYMKADRAHPRMGLNNKICRYPQYWCRLHEVWLSEDDVKNKKCKQKPTFDLIGMQLCGNLVKSDKFKSG